MCDTNGFSEEYLDNMSNELGNIASAVTGIQPGAGGWKSMDWNKLKKMEWKFDIGNMLSCQPGSECYKTKRTKKLQDAWDNRANTFRDAPIDLSRAEKNYFLYNKGENGGEDLYNKTIIDRFARTAEQFKRNSIEMQQQFMVDLAQALKQYEEQVIFQVQSAKLLKTREEEQKVLKKNINYYQKIVQTSERKVVYENQNMDTLYMYRRIMFFIYYAALIFFIVFGNFITDKLYLKVSVWLLLVIFAVFPIILNMLIRWVFVIGDAISYWYSDPHYGYGRFQQYKDPYYDIGNPFDEAPPQAPNATALLPPSITTNLSPRITKALSTVGG
jgi:hypothetical protein